MVRVPPAIGPEYYLVDQQGDGNFVQQDNPGTMVSPAMWRVFNW